MFLQWNLVPHRRTLSSTGETILRVQKRILADANGISRDVRWQISNIDRNGTDSRGVSICKCVDDDPRSRMIESNNHYTERTNHDRADES